MKGLDKKVSLGELCSLFGYKRQNFYKVRMTYKWRSMYEDEVLSIVREVRVDQPKIGTFKLQSILNSRLSEPIGRDRLNNLLRDKKLLVRRRKKYRPKMTDGNGKSLYPDFRKGLKVKRINQLWCSDFTYIMLLRGGRHCYLLLITDEYSHLIVGYHLGLRMRSAELLVGLEKALSKQLPEGKQQFDDPLIFHSDRGGQYKSEEFKKRCDKHNIVLSMCAKGRSHENPVAERVNGILKNELLEEDSFADIDSARNAIEKAILVYNKKRPHLSCEMLTPQQAHAKGSGPLKKLWRQRKKRTKKNAPQT